MRAFPSIFPSTSIELRSREGFLIRSGDKVFSFSGVRMTLTNRQLLDLPESVPGQSECDVSRPKPVSAAWLVHPLFRRFSISGLEREDELQSQWMAAKMTMIVVVSVGGFCKKCNDTLG